MRIRCVSINSFERGYVNRNFMRGCVSKQRRETNKPGDKTARGLQELLSIGQVAKLAFSCDCAVRRMTKEMCGNS